MSESGQLPAPAYEAEDADIGVIAITAGALAVIVGLGILVAVLLRLRVGRDEPNRFQPAPDELIQHGPGAKTSIQASWAEIDSSVRRNLEEFGWIDRSSGLVRIPIERAMDLAVSEKEGAPPQAKKAAP